MNERIKIVAIVIDKATTVYIHVNFLLLPKMWQPPPEDEPSYSHEQQQQHTRCLDALKKEFLSIYTNPPTSTRHLQDYDIVKTLGHGGYSTILLVRDKRTLEILTMKAVEKADIVHKNQVKQILCEKRILQSVQFPFTTTITAGFTDNVYVYFVMAFESGGELFSLIRKSRSLSETLSKFYAGQVILGLEYLHHCSVIHRDVKPENIFISREGYIKLGDYGFSKLIKSRTWTLCGTPEYIAPEIILSKGYSFAVDWWAMGVLIFEMICGYTPFFSNNKEKQYDKIISGIYKIPDGVNSACKALMKRLLVVEPTKRFGSLKAGVYDIKSAKWFSDIDWVALYQKKIKPPYIPEVQNLGDAENFPECEDVKLKNLSTCLFENEFTGF